MEFDNNGNDIYDEVTYEYQGPAFEIPSSVSNLKRIPRFGHGSDITAVFSPYQDDQVDYAAGLIALFVSLLVFFIFWIIVILTFKCMGAANAGFLSGHHFVIPPPEEDEKNIYKRPRRVRSVFIVATALLMLFAFLLVALGFTNVNNAATTMGESLMTTEEILDNAEKIAVNLEKIGVNSMEIRDAAVEQLDNLCPADPNIGDKIGMDIFGIAEQAQSDLTMLANFIKDGLEVGSDTLLQARAFTDSANNATKQIQFWDWEMKLMAAALFILPSFLAVGVGLVMLDLDIKSYQNALTYFFMPLFTLTIIACFVVCCAILPISAGAADSCSGGGTVYGGPDDTILTVYRNLRGDDTSEIFQFMAFYTQQCKPEYNPFGFLQTYLNELDNAVESTNTAADAISQSQDLLSAQCGREFGSVLEIVEDMSDNLKLLQQQVDVSLDLVSCENINKLYVNTVHEAGCTYSVTALSWIFASSLVISVCGMIMIMLRASYYPCDYLELDDTWLKDVPTKSASRDSDDNTDPYSTKRGVQSAVPVQVPQVHASDEEEFEFQLPQSGQEMYDPHQI